MTETDRGIELVFQELGYPCLVMQRLCHTVEDIETAFVEEVIPLKKEKCSRCLVGNRRSTNLPLYFESAASPRSELIEEYMYREFWAKYRADIKRT